jgi:hypothetical protein
MTIIGVAINSQKAIFFFFKMKKTNVKIAIIGTIINKVPIVKTGINASASSIINEKIKI